MRIELIKIYCAWNSTWHRKPMRSDNGQSFFIFHAAVMEVNVTNSDIVKFNLQLVAMLGHFMI